MVKYELKDDLLTGHSLIDAQHKELFDAINDLMDACESGKGRDHLERTYTFLKNYIVKHFNDEEELQASVHFPDYNRHKDLHEQYKAMSNAAGDVLLKDGPTFEALAGLNKAILSLVNHVRIEDKKAATFIREN